MYLLHSTKMSSFSKSTVTNSFSPETGSVLLTENHCKIALRSYVLPCMTCTGSRNKDFVRGQHKCDGALLEIAFSSSFLCSLRLNAIAFCRASSSVYEALYLYMFIEKLFFMESPVGVSLQDVPSETGYRISSVLLSDTASIMYEQVATNDCVPNSSVLTRHRS